MQKYKGIGPVNRIGLYPVPDWRDYILALWSRYRKRREDLEFTGDGDWWLRLTDKGVAELRKIARELGYKRNYAGIEAMLSAADRLDVGYAIRSSERDPRPRLRELAGLQ
jgi:hypothetical protein